MYLSFWVTAEVPRLVVTVTSTVPDPAGAVAVSEPELPTDTLVAGLPPKLTVVPPGVVSKLVPVTVTEVMIRFKRPRRRVLDDTELPPANYYRFRLSPQMMLAVGTTIKKSGERMQGEEVELIAHNQRPDDMQPYERLLGDAAIGEATLFARQDAVEAAWRVVDPVLGNVTPIMEYEPNTWGPPLDDRTFAPVGG